MSEALLFPEVERIDENGCRLISSLSTQSSSGAREKNVRGIMWHIIPSTSIDVLGFEFDYINGATGSDLSIQLYARKGNFENFVSNEGAWSKIAETIAVPSPEGLGAIIPAKEIRPIQAEEGEIYSFYLHMTSEPVLEVTSPSEDTQVGSVWYEDDQMEISVGIGLSSGPFPDGGDVMGPSQFRGRLHYSAVKSCNETLTATEVELEFAVDSNPEAEVISELNTSVDQAARAALVLNPDLVRFGRFHDMILDDIRSSFRGRDDEKCPTDFPLCSLIFSTLTFSHSYSIGPGTLTYGVLTSGGDIGESVENQNTFPTAYVGDPLTSGEFLIKLEGMPTGAQMNVLQRRYFEKVTASFLSVFAETPIYRVDVTDVRGQNGSGGVVTRKRQRRSLRGDMDLSDRFLQSDDGVAEVIVTIFGSGTQAELREAVFGSIGENAQRYADELAKQQLRPGEINEQDSGALFEDIVGSSVSLKPQDFQDENGALSGGKSDDDRDAIYLYLSIVALVMSLMWLLYRVYKDYFSDRSERMGKSQREMDFIETASLGGWSQHSRGGSVRRPHTFHTRNLSSHSRTLDIQSRPHSFHSRPLSFHDRRPNNIQDRPHSFHERRPQNIQSRPHSFHERRPQNIQSGPHSFHERRPQNIQSGPHSFHERRPQNIQSRPSSFHAQLKPGSAHTRGYHTVHTRSFQPGSAHSRPVPPERSHSDHRRSPQNRAGSGGRGVTACHSMPIERIPSRADQSKHPANEASSSSERRQPPAKRSIKATKSLPLQTKPTNRKKDILVSNGKVGGPRDEQRTPVNLDQLAWDTDPESDGADNSSSESDERSEAASIDSSAEGISAHGQRFPENGSTTSKSRKEKTSTKIRKPILPAGQSLMLSPKSASNSSSKLKKLAEASKLKKLAAAKQTNKDETESKSQSNRSKKFSVTRKVPLQQQKPKGEGHSQARKDSGRAPESASRSFHSVRSTSDRSAPRSTRSFDRSAPKPTRSFNTVKKVPLIKGSKSFDPSSHPFGKGGKIKFQPNNSKKK